LGSNLETERYYDNVFLCKPIKRDKHVTSLILRELELVPVLCVVGLL